MQKNNDFKIKSDKALAKLTKEQLADEYNSAKDQLVIAREELAANPDSVDAHNKLEDLDIYIATISDLMSKTFEAAKKEKPQREQPTVSDGAYVPEPGLEGYIHLELVRGQRFDPETGKQIGVVRKQCYTYKQFLQLKRNAALLGYKYKILYAPADLKDKI